VGLDLKRPRGPVLALIVVGAVILTAAIVGVVALAAGGSDSTSSSGLDTSFTEPAHFESVDAVYGEETFTCSATDSPCVEEYLRKVTDDYGPKASLGILDRLEREHKVDPGAVNDHQMAHVVGRETAKDYGSNFKAFDLCPITFNYGCSHGFFEYVLARTDTPKQAATTICESLSGSNHFLTAGFSCYHGVGHGIMMAEAYNVSNSLKACNTMPKASAQDGCWQGVFMENVNAGMTGRALPGVFKKSDPLSPCDKVENRYKHECYINHAGWLMTVAKDDIRKGTRYCLKAKPDQYKSSCWQSIGLMVTNPVWQAPLAPELHGQPEEKVAAALCKRFPTAGQKDCVLAAVDNLANFDQLKVTREHAFCLAAPKAFQSDCYTRIGMDIGVRTRDQALIRKSCGELGDKATLCLQGAGVPPT
jgi:hypothetical protein